MIVYYAAELKGVELIRHSSRSEGGVDYKCIWSEGRRIMDTEIKTK